MLTEVKAITVPESVATEWCVYLNAYEARLLWTDDHYREQLMQCCELFDTSYRPAEIAC